MDKRRTKPSRNKGRNKGAGARTSNTSENRRPSPEEEQGFVVYGAYADLSQTNNGLKALETAGFVDEAVTVSSLTPVRADTDPAEPRINLANAIGRTAKVAGSLLALGAAPLLAPMLLPAVLFGAVGGAARERQVTEGMILVRVHCRDLSAAVWGRKALEDTGASSVGLGASERPQTDLKNREYRDQHGEVHHHTRTYLRDHGPEHSDPVEV